LGWHLLSGSHSTREAPEGNLVTDRNANKMWGGRFSMSPAEVMQEINASIAFDKALAPQDIRASKAHAAMLAAQGIISKDDARKINAGLDRVLEEIAAGRFQSPEDVHMNVESGLEG
jgi:argininosuccinate lyase